jgi:dihydroxy-acid dehydratase
LNAIARHIGVELTLADWEEHGADVPLLVNLQPAGEYLGEDYYRAGGVPAVMGMLHDAGLLDGSAITCTGASVAETVAGITTEDEKVIRPLDRPIKEHAGLTVLTGNLFDGAVMKLSVISEQFRERFLCDPDDPDAFEGRVVVFDGPEDYHARIEDPVLAIDERTILVIRGAGPVGYPGGAEVVNMRPPAALIRAGVHNLPCIGDGRQSGTSYSPSILNAAPEAAVGGGLALLRTGDIVRIDLRQHRADVLLDAAELDRRRAELAEVEAALVPESQTPWQEIQRGITGQFDTGATLEPAVKYQNIAEAKGLPRDSH